MLEPKAGFTIHTISKMDDETGLHEFRRRDRKQGKLISYVSSEPLQVYVPTSIETLTELLESYKTSIGEKNFTGVTGALARFSLHDLESYFGGMKSELPKDGLLDDEEEIQAQVAKWVAWQGRDTKKVAKPKASRDKLEELAGDPEATAEYLRSIGVDI